ncbi:MAG: MFS transporter [Chloroflexi bacterium]|nr:MFS transporter [Chloroflexota bacterium]
MLRGRATTYPPRRVAGPCSFLSATTFLFWASLYLYVPILPQRAESGGAGLSMVGAVIASYAIAQLLLRVPIGVWADSHGRHKPFVVGGLLFASLGAVSMAATSGRWLLFAGRATTGIAAATWVVSTVHFSSYFPADRSVRGIGIISFVNSSAMVVATFLGGRLAQAWGAESVFFIAGGLGIVGALLLMPVPEPRRHRASAPCAGTLFQVAIHPVVLMASMMAILVHFANAATISSFTLVYAARLGASPRRPRPSERHISRVGDRVDAARRVPGGMPKLPRHSGPGGRHHGRCPSGEPHDHGARTVRRPPGGNWGGPWPDLHCAHGIEYQRSGSRPPCYGDGCLSGPLRLWDVGRPDSWGRCGGWPWHRLCLLYVGRVCFPGGRRGHPGNEATETLEQVSPPPAGMLGR